MSNLFLLKLCSITNQRYFFMKRILILITFFVISHYVFPQGWRKGEMEVNVKVKSVEDLHYLHRKGWSYDQPSSIPGMARVYLIDKELDILKESGLDYDIRMEDIRAGYDRMYGGMVPPGYYTYEEIIAIADSLVAAFPAICQKTVIGLSMQNRQLAVLKISDQVDVDEPEAEIFFEGGIHGDEVGGSENMIRFARDLCIGYGSNTQITQLINNREIFILLMVNPDGRVMMSRYNANSVDLNRDGGYMWMGEGNSPSAWSQTETRAVRNFLADHQFVVFSDYHSGTEFISYPWSYRPQSTLDHNHIHSLAQVYANSSGYSNIPYAAGYSGMYPINGSTKDFNYGMWGRIGWSIEISNSKQPPASQVYSYYMKNKPAMLALIDKCNLGLWGMVTDSVTGNPVAARITVNNTVPFYSDPEVGDFHKYLVPGNYNLKVQANGYKTKTFNGVTIGSNATVQQNVVLAPQQKYFAYRVEASYIPNNNFEDEGYTWASMGPPDGENYSLGKNGWIILDMLDTLHNGNGNDFRVVESDASPEAYTAYISLFRDGPWKLVGTGNGTTEFDLAAASLPQARYIKIVDNGTGAAQTNNAGFDLDAVEILYIPSQAGFVTSNSMPCAGQTSDFMDVSSGTPVSWQWQFPGGSPASSSLQHPSGILYPTSGLYDVTLTVSDGTQQSTLTRQAYIQVFDAPTTPQVPQGDTLLCEGQEYSVYYTSSPSNTLSSEWSLQPVEAGVLSGSLDSAVVYWAPGFTGEAFLFVRQITPCGVSNWSEGKNIVLYPRPVVSLGNDTVVPAFAILTLDAGNPGCSYLWNTGEITQTLQADSSGFGAGVRLYWVYVTSPGNCTVSDTISIHFSIEAGIPSGEIQKGIVYPNPAADVFWFQIPENAEWLDIRVLNSEGQSLISERRKSVRKEETVTIHCRDWTSGLYYLRIQVPGHQYLLPVLVHGQR